jgi:hypothetical protein
MLYPEAIASTFSVRAAKSPTVVKLTTPYVGVKPCT